MKIKHWNKDINKHPKQFIKKSMLAINMDFLYHYKINMNIMLN